MSGEAEREQPAAPRERVLKRDGFGTISLLREGDRTIVVRDTRGARRWARWLARTLARRERNALAALESVAGVPQLIGFDGERVRRTFIAGQPLHEARPTDPAFYRAALALVRRTHRAGVAHNDLAKEANWLRTTAGEPAIIDFQLAVVRARRGWLFRLLAREDLRHLLKHKRCYAPHALTARQRALLAAPSVPARFWRTLVKPLYRMVTRRLLRWPERHGPTERRS